MVLTASRIQLIITTVFLPCQYFIHMLLLTTLHRYSHKNMVEHKGRRGCMLPNLTLSTNKYRFGIYKFNYVLRFLVHLFGFERTLSTQ